MTVLVALGLFTGCGTILGIEDFSPAADDSDARSDLDGEIDARSDRAARSDGELDSRSDRDGPVESGFESEVGTRRHIDSGSEEGGRDAADDVGDEATGSDGASADVSSPKDASGTSPDGSKTDAPSGAEGGQDSTAPEGGRDAGTGDVGVLGSACSAPGELACAGNAQKVALICNGDDWALASVCPSSQNCDSTPGSNQGTCTTIDPLCANASPGNHVCSSSTTVVECGPDLVSDSPVETCNNQACVDGTCTGVCSPGATQCSGDAVETCEANGQWSAAVPCALTTPFCTNGACTLL
jgi:hypothetical protein